MDRQDIVAELFVRLVVSVVFATQHINQLHGILLSDWADEADIVWLAVSIRKRPPNITN